MSTNITVTGKKSTLPDGFVILVNNQIINRFISWEINHSLDIVPMSMDQTPSEIPDGKIMTFVSEASYPMSDASGWQTFQQNLVNVTAKRNWGRGDVISLSVVGTKNPVTNKPWEINSLIKIAYNTDHKPQMSEEYVISDLTFTLSREEHETHLTLVRKEALGVRRVIV